MSVWDMVFYGCAIAVVALLVAMLVSTFLIDWMEDREDKEELQALQCLLKGESHG